MQTLRLQPEDYIAVIQGKMIQASTPFLRVGNIVCITNAATGTYTECEVNAVVADHVHFVPATTR